MSSRASTEYLDLPPKALLYKAASNDPERRNTQYVLTALLDKLLPLLTPLVPSLREDAHQYQPSIWWPRSGHQLAGFRQ
jgi:isoleucyl-tRNA synthetase